MLAAVALVVSVPAAASQSALEPASAHAEGIAVLWWSMLAGAVIIFTAVMLILGLGLRRSSKPFSAQASRNLVIVAGVAIPLVIIISLVGGSLTLGNSIAATPPENALKVRITGWMWWWEIEYLNERGDVVATTANELHIPVGQPVTATDGAGSESSMKHFRTLVYGLLALLITGSAAASCILYFGIYNVSALQQHTGIVFQVLEYARIRSIAVRSDEEVPDFADIDWRGSGVAVYQEHCTHCHGALGVPPEDEIWAITALIKEMPSLTPEDYAELRAATKAKQQADLPAAAVRVEGNRLALGRAALQQYNCTGCHRVPKITAA